MGIHCIVFSASLCLKIIINKNVYYVLYTGQSFSYTDTTCVFRYGDQLSQKGISICNEKCPRETPDLCMQALFLGSIYGRKRRHIEKKRSTKKKKKTQTVLAQKHEKRKKKACWESTASVRWCFFLWSHRQLSSALNCWQGVLSNCIECIWNLFL